MNWTQVIDPLHAIGLSALMAAIPIFIIFWALIIKKMKGYKASMLTTSCALLIAIVIYGMPVKIALLSTFHGMLYGLFPISWIIIGAVFLYNITVKSGQFEIIKNFMASITPDRRLQALLIAFSFGSFLEGAVGFGPPVAISAAMLVGLGFNPLYAAGLCLVANTAPVAFGAVGTPIIIAAQVSDLPVMAISQMVGRTLPILSIVVPFYLVALMCGFKKTKELLPPILVSGISFAFFQWLTSNYLGPMLPDVIAGLASIICLMVFLKYWKPKTIWRFSEENGKEEKVFLKYTTGQIFRAWSPFIIMTVIIIAWGLKPVQMALNSFSNTYFDIPGLTNSILKPEGSPLVIKPFQLNFISNSGTALLVSSIIAMPLIGMNIRTGLKVYLATLNQLKFPVLTITLVVAFAFIMNNSGMSVTIAIVLAGTGALFPFFSPILGWLGVFLTGSDTSSNALFSKLQATSANAIGVDPLITVGANASGGVTGKMISPQSIAIGSAAVGLVGRESELFRFTVKHSFVMLFVVCLITTMQAYLIPWIVPKYDKLNPVEKSVDVSEMSRGFLYIITLVLVLGIIILTCWFLNRRKTDPLTLS